MSRIIGFTARERQIINAVRRTKKDMLELERYWIQHIIMVSSKKFYTDEQNRVRPITPRKFRSSFLPSELA